MNVLPPISIKTILNHFACWSLLIVYELGVYSFTLNKLPSIDPYFFYYCLNITLFYYQVSVLNLTLCNDKRRYFLLLLLVFSGVLLVLGIKIGADTLLTDFSGTSLSKWKMLKSMGTLDLFRNIYFAALGTLYWTIKNINSYQKKADTAEISRLKAANDNADLAVRLAKSKNAYLQQQINPHLFFNTLNFIHNSVYKLSREAAENIILLSDIMRYSLEATDSEDKVTLGNEAEQIKNLIKLNRFRFDYPLDISYATEGNLDSHKIIPLVIMTLAENLFKHGDLCGKPAIIRLSVSDGGSLKFYTSNYKRPKPPVKTLKSIGLENIRIRLNYTYYNNYRLTVNETDEIYESELSLNL